MHCPGGNATDPIWRVQVSSDGISSWTPLQPQHSNLKPNPLAYQIWCFDFLSPPTPLTSLTDSLPSLNLLCHSKSIHARWSKSSLKHSIRFCGVFSKFKQNFIAYRSSKVSSRPDCIFEIYQLWQSGFSWVYSNCCCSGSFEREIIKIGQSSYRMYSNETLSFQESTTIWNACTKKPGNLLNAPRNNNSSGIDSKFGSWFGCMLFDRNFNEYGHNDRRSGYIFHMSPEVYQICFS